jgi:uncharacterized protein (TIGR03437 family)
MLMPRWKAALATVLCAGTFSQVSLAQVASQLTSPTILQIDVENLVEYQEDTSDLTKFASDPSLPTSVAPKNFTFRVGIGDIVAVNGQPAKGIMIRNIRQILLKTAPDAGQALADSVRNGVVGDTFEILKSDSTPIGTIVSSGLAAGSTPVGGPLSITQGTFAIVGGTGAFLGARGQYGNSVTAQSTPIRVASITEDPSNRRRNGGGRVKFVMQLIPISQLQIVTTAAGPAVTHSSDFTLVTATKPAAAGEILSLFATGLGPTVPRLDPGQPFPASPPARVNSPVDVTVNGKSAEVIGAVGYPGAVDGYQVNFRVPTDTAKGSATVQVIAAWIAGGSVSIPIQ